MAILLYHDATTHGMIATSSAPIAGTPYPPRRYQHDGHYIVLEGPAPVIAHDAEEICKIAGYRLATPAESDAYYQTRRAQGTLTEADKPDDLVTLSTPAPESAVPTSQQTLTTETAPSGLPRGRRKG
jgi:hypothetical protein